MTTDEILEILDDSSTVAVVGMSRNPAKPAHTVPVHLSEHGFLVIPVNPSATEISGLKCYPTLTDIPGEVDIVNVFRPSKEALDVVKEAIKRHEDRGDIKCIWLQLGIQNDDARKLAEAAGIKYVQDRCMYIEHMRTRGK